jgi:hypothetical protein
METLIKAARAIESHKDIDARVGFAAFGDSIAILPSYEGAGGSLEAMQVPLALVPLERGATIAKNLRNIAEALEALGEL